MASTAERFAVNSYYLYMYLFYFCSQSKAGKGVCHSNSEAFGLLVIYIYFSFRKFSLCLSVSLEIINDTKNMYNIKRSFEFFFSFSPFKNKFQSTSAGG